MFWKYVRRPFFCDPTTDDDSRSSSPETDRADVLKVWNYAAGSATKQSKKEAADANSQN